MGLIGGEEGVQEATAGREERILVSVRLRPLNDKEINKFDVCDWECSNDTTIIYKNHNLSASDRSLYPTSYTFDRVFRPGCPTRQVYETAAKEVALSVLKGINASIFAYGQTSSGKTYTMSGVTEYAIADIFNQIGMEKEEREFVLKFSAMEIYNESVRDLLTADATPLRVFDDPERGTVVEKLTEATLRDWNHFKELLSFCEAQRKIGETSLNEASSRSHQILKFTVESCPCDFLVIDRSSSLAASVNFIDLAGSERASQTHAAGARSNWSL
ncbi:Kinesin-like protein KIN-7G [Stylosanthes scabra]|uniref:Kinesin-like protein n=1 Tax=Stylosanthes scabra TaxID=79078 RepID=A0ABU6UJN1_9FABA|nr:Kinesin-like protein KIN-7G [Stylosanthes scabra]